MKISGIFSFIARKLTQSGIRWLLSRIFTSCVLSLLWGCSSISFMRVSLLYKSWLDEWLSTPSCGQFGMLKIVLFSVRKLEYACLELFRHYFAWWMKGALEDAAPTIADISKCLSCVSLPFHQISPQLHISWTPLPQGRSILTDHLMRLMARVEVNG